MTDNQPISGGEAVADSGKALVLQDLRQALASTSVKLVDSPYIVDIAQMFLANASYAKIIERFGERNVELAKSTLKVLRTAIKGLPEDLKMRVAAAPPLPGTVGSKEPTSVEVLKSNMDSVARRIAAIEEEIRTAVDQKRTVSDKREDQLMKYYQMHTEMRKDLERERLQSEVVQAYKRAAVDICMLAMEFISDDRAKRSFIEKVREHERRNL